VKGPLLIAAAFAALIASSAIAVAQQPRVYRRPVAYAPVASWTGFYAGVNGGYGWSQTEVDPIGTNLFCNPVGGGCPLAAAQVAAVPAVLGTNPKGGLVGGQVGYNYQFGSWVAGLEADLDWTNIAGSGVAVVGPVAIVVGIPQTVAGAGTADERLRYFGTVRGRLGYLIANPLLVYATGGLAYGQINSNTVVTNSLIGPCGPACVFNPGAGSTTTTKAGWTVGGGLEYLLGSSWTVKAEYLYYNLGSTSYAVGPLVSTFGPGFPAATIGVQANTADFKGNIVRVGLNYKFGNYYAPVR
jgi:outer membrane immunogenic protein